MKYLTPLGAFVCGTFLLPAAGKRRFFLDYQTGRYEDTRGFPFFERVIQGDIRTDALSLLIRKNSRGQSYGYIKWRKPDRPLTFLGGSTDEKILLNLKESLASRFGIEISPNTLF